MAGHCTNPPCEFLISASTCWLSGSSSRKLIICSSGGCPYATSAKPDDEHGGRRWFRGTKGVSGKWVQDVDEGEVTPGWRTAVVLGAEPLSLLSRLNISFCQAGMVQPQGNLLECFLPVIKKCFFIIETKRTLKLQPQQANKSTFNHFPATFIFVLAAALPERFRERN